MAFKFARPIHPGEYLREEFLVPLGISAGALARRVGLPRTRIERIVREEVGITPDTALRLARYFQTTPQFWLNFDQAYALEMAERAIAPTLEKIEPIALDAA
ncbi:MAG: HigA family addiction module antitoxin [Rhizobiaceae bacterium]